MLYIHLIYPIALFKLVGLMQTNKLMFCNIIFIATALWVNTMTKIYGNKKTIQWLTYIIIIHILIQQNKPYFIFKIPCHDLVPFFLTTLWVSIVLGVYLFARLQHRYNFYISNLLSLIVTSITDSLLSDALLLTKLTTTKVLSIFLCSLQLKLTLTLVGSLCLIVMVNLYQWIKKYIHILSWQSINKPNLQTRKHYIFTLILLLLTPYPSKSLGLALGPVVEYVMPIFERSAHVPNPIVGYTTQISEKSERMLDPVVKHTTQILEQLERFTPSHFPLNKQGIQGGLFAQVNLPLIYIRSAILYSRNYSNLANGQQGKCFHDLTIPINLGSTLLSTLHYHIGIVFKKLLEAKNKKISTEVYSKKLLGPICGLGCNIGNFFTTLNMTLLISTEKISQKYSICVRLALQAGYNIAGL